MSKTVLLIESDPTFARDMSAALESRGFGVRTSSEGKEGVELARALRPDCVVLCVELPGLSGYSWCNRLKKDDALKAIPLVITSSEATPETFEQHRKLKTRAEDYLIKPFLPATLVERVGALVGMPDSPAAGEEELVTLADVELDAPIDGGPPLTEEDADLKMLDDAFDSISGGGGADEPSTRAPGSPVSEPPLTLLPDADESPAILDLDREMAEALASLAEEAATPTRVSRLAPSPPPPPPSPPVRLVQPTVVPPAEEETPILLEDVEVLPTIDVTDGSLAITLQASQEEARTLRAEVDRVRRDAAGWEDRVVAQEVELSSARALLESSDRSVLALTGELETARGTSRLAQERTSELERELAALLPRLAEAERSLSARGAEALASAERASALERALEEARSEIATVRSQAETLRAEADAHRIDVDSLRGESQAFQSEIDGIRAERDAFRLEVETVRAERDSVRLEVGTFRAEGDSLRSELGAFRAQGDSLRSELEALRSEASSLLAERDGMAADLVSVRTEAESRAGELSRQLQDAQAQSAQHEDRVLRAYQKIKSDEKLREKTRKALAMVIQVLEDRSPGDGTPPSTPPER